VGRRVRSSSILEANCTLVTNMSTSEPGDRGRGSERSNAGEEGVKPPTLLLRGGDVQRMKNKKDGHQKTPSRSSGRATWCQEPGEKEIRNPRPSTNAGKK